MSAPARPASRCGTAAGAQAHYRAGQSACPACTKAQADYYRAYRASRGRGESMRVSYDLLIELLRSAPEHLREAAVGELGLPLLLEWDVL